MWPPNVEIDTAEELARFDGCVAVDGNIVVGFDVEDVGALSSLQSVTGALSVNATALPSLSLPSMQEVGFLQVFASSSVLTSVSAPTLARAGAIQILDDQPALAELSLPALEVLDANISPEAVSCANASGLCPGWLIMRAGQSLDTLTFPALRSVAGVAIELGEGNGLTSLVFPELTGETTASVGRAAVLVATNVNDGGAGDSSLGARFIGAHTDGSGDFGDAQSGVERNTALQNLSLPRLRRGSVGLVGLSAFETLDAPVWGEPGPEGNFGLVVLASLPSTRTVDVPVLNLEGGDLSLLLRDLPIIEMLTLRDVGADRAGVDISFVGEGALVCDDPMAPDGCGDSRVPTLETVTSALPSDLPRLLVTGRPSP